MSQQKATRLVVPFAVGTPAFPGLSVQWGTQTPTPLPIYSRTHTHACIHTHMHILCPGSALEVLEMGSSQGEQRHNYKGSCLHQAGRGFGDRTRGNGKGTRNVEVMQGDMDPTH